MPLAALLALSIIASDAPPPPPDAPVTTQTPAPAPAPAPSEPRATRTIRIGQPAADEDGWDEFPANAPRDDYGLVSWCYGALDEYLALYEVVKPDLKEIDKIYGSPVKESEPYHEDILGERQALKRFAAAMEAAERASPTPIAKRGVAAMDMGRGIWAEAKLEPHRKMADAWLFWGVPKRCETTAKSLKASATLLGQAMAVGAPSVDGPSPAAPAAPAPGSVTPTP